MSRTCELVVEGKISDIVMENSAFPGVRRVAEKVARDVKKVCGVIPRVISTDYFLTPDITPENRLKILEDLVESSVVLVGTLENSELIECLDDLGVVDFSVIRGKREVYKIELVGNSMVIAGSDKLGTIFGLFALSEYIGVSPMVKFGDALPQPKKELIIGEDIQVVSKEPSVKYRGFFINDEWPCFGNWAVKHFGGFNSKMYDEIFEFLLRMKGNTLWPAMWASSFPIDGPGSQNEELADLYGITISYSHHEPCLRASEEWDKLKGPNSPYGTEWNFSTNKEGLINYWMDSLKRSGKYNHLVTIGMRGERDSSMLGPDATMKENIDLLRSVIVAQRGLIMHYINFNLDKVPQILALYKEVESYFYGDEETEGLKDFKELENVIFMLCEDNYGHMRTLPTKELREHKGGFGMYYHLDYHGGPVSYEWMPSTPLSLIWEQMTEAYEYGVRDVWIVNAGDVKGNEVALNYFMDLAYDFDKWGSGKAGSWKEYLEQWAKKSFPCATKEQQDALAKIYTDFVQMNFMRRPEALNAAVYHPCNYCEADRMLAKIAVMEKMNEEVYEALDRISRLAAYSMVYYPAKISANLVKMQLFAGKNQYYAAQGRMIANEFANAVKQCMDEDARLCEEFASFRNGKWTGMELEKHIGFTKWNEDGWHYPMRCMVEPVNTPRMSVSRSDFAMVATKNYGAPQCIRIYDFLDMERNSVDLEIGNDGVGSLKYKIVAENGEIPAWLKISPLEAEVETMERVTITCDREQLWNVARASGKVGAESKEGDGAAAAPMLVKTPPQKVRLLIGDGTTIVAVEVMASYTLTEGFEKNTFLPTGSRIVMEANHFAEKKDMEGAAFVHLPGHGRSGNGMKVLPSTAEFDEKDEKPELTYRFVIPREGKYRVELWTSPVNSLVRGRALRAQVSFGKQKNIVNILDENYKGGELGDPRWCVAVMNQIHIVPMECSFKAGVQTLTIGAMEAGMVLERIVIYPADQRLETSYLGPEESYYTK